MSRKLRAVLICQLCGVAGIWHEILSLSAFDGASDLPRRRGLQEIFEGEGSATVRHRCKACFEIPGTCGTVFLIEASFSTRW